MTNTQYPDGNPVLGLTDAKALLQGLGYSDTEIDAGHKLFMKHQVSEEPLGIDKCLEQAKKGMNDE